MPSTRDFIAAGSSALTLHLGDVAWELVRIPEGELWMGSPLSDPDREPGEIPCVPIKITRPFYLGRHLVTQAQYKAVMGGNPARFKGEGLPVDQILYNEALELCRRLSGHAGVTVTLPTEAQWEHACRAGTRTRYYSGDTVADLDGIGWYRGNAAGAYHAGGEKQPNAWGLFDMLGNLYEPCLDYLQRFPEPGAADPLGRCSRDHGAMRGGAWVEPADRCRAATRVRTDDSFGPMGIRIAINP